jgi:hypothetical protein
MADQHLVTLGDARDLPAKFRVPIQAAEQDPRVLVHGDLVGGHQRTGDLRIRSDLAHSRPIGVRLGAEGDVSSLDIRIQTEEIGPEREELHDARPGGAHSNK